jgi:acetoin utilization deacetylase AcuC-like enzyme
MEHFTTALARARDYRPQFVLLAAGFDAYRDDPIGSFCLEEEHFREITRRLRDLAAACCGGRLLATLEGGYHPSALPELIAAHLEELL